MFPVLEMVNGISTLLYMGGKLAYTGKVGGPNPSPPTTYRHSKPNVVQIVVPERAKKEPAGKNRTLFMPHSDLRPPYGLLILGVFLLVLAVNGTCTAEAWAHFGLVVYRDEEPKQFWWLVASQYLGGLGLIGYFLYKVYGL